jgi:hypothetical protein
MLFISSCTAAASSEGLHPICLIANLLDPRCKLVPLELSDADYQEIKNKVFETMKAINEKATH